MYTHVCSTQSSGQSLMYDREIDDKQGLGGRGLRKVTHDEGGVSVRSSQLRVWSQCLKTSSILSFEDREKTQFRMIPRGVVPTNSDYVRSYEETVRNPEFSMKIGTRRGPKIPYISYPVSSVLVSSLWRYKIKRRKKTIGSETETQVEQIK